MTTAQELLTLCDEHHLPQPRATALMFFGWALAHRGDVAEGIRHLEEGLRIWDRLGARVYLARAICLLAEVYLQGGRYADGVKQVDLALATAVEIGDEATYLKCTWSVPRCLRILDAAMSRVQRRACSRASRFHELKVQEGGNFAPRPSSLASGATKASAPKPAISSRPSTAGSPKASTRRT